MHRAVNVGVLGGLVAHQTVDHLLRHLAGCGVVQIHQRLVVDLQLEDGKVSANAFDIKGGGRIGGVACGSWLA